MITREIIIGVDKDKSGLLLLTDFNLKSIDQKAYEARKEDIWTSRYINTLGHECGGRGCSISIDRLKE